MKNFVKGMFLFFLTIATPIVAQVNIDSTEITSDVPALTDFHNIIYPMWHKAYPAKDINALKGMVPEIKGSMVKINQAILPGILKDKEDKWKYQLNELNAAADNYYKASEDDNGEALLAAAEKLHYNYEMMVRVIRPVIKEMDEYHQSLYIIYHKLYPDKKYTEIAGFMDDLVIKANAIVLYSKEKLKRRLGNNIEKFEFASKELYDATVSLKEVLKGSDLKAKGSAVENMHTRYRQLDSLFN